MVQVETLIAFLVVGAVWGASDAFMEVGSKKSDLKSNKDRNLEEDLEKYDKKKNKKKSNKKSKSQSIEKSELYIKGTIQIQI